MADGFLDLHARQGRPSSANAPTQGLGWLPVALGGAVLLAGLGNRKTSPMALALTAVAGVAAAAALRGAETDRGPRGGTESGSEPEVERSITIGRTADELRHCWRDPETLPKIVAGFATVRPIGDGRMHWTVKGPMGRTYDWDSEIVEEQPDQGIGWRSLPDAGVANAGTIRFRPAPPDRGTVATLRLRFDPPRSTLGDIAVEVLGTTPIDMVADDVLRRFKSLAETGEIPTTERQPAARADTR